MRKLLILLSLLSLFAMSGCAVTANEAVLGGGESNLKLRQIQTRYFDTDDKKKTMECVVATLQDLGFVIDKASFDLGNITGTKLSGYQLKMTVTITPRGTDKMTVRANAQYNITPVEDPVPYQQFFDALAKSLFLRANIDE